MAISGRIYTTGFSNSTVLLAQDLIGIYTGATKVVGIQSVNLGSLASATQNLRVRLRYLPPTVTSGSGGTAGTVARTVPGDAAATVTSRLNDTTQATSSGTAVDLWDDVWNTVNGFIWVPPTSLRPFVIGLSSAFIVSLDTPPSLSLACNGSVTLEELP